MNRPLNGDTQPNFVFFFSIPASVNSRRQQTRHNVDRHGKQSRNGSNNTRLRMAAVEVRGGYKYYGSPSDPNKKIVLNYLNMNVLNGSM